VLRAWQSRILLISFLCLQFSEPEALKALSAFGSTTGVATRCVPPNLVRQLQLQGRGAGEQVAIQNPHTSVKTWGDILQGTPKQQLDSSCACVVRCCPVLPPVTCQAAHH
jgi:hypothetical protein